MEEELVYKLKLKAVREMKAPTILMNDKDFERFEKELEAKVVNFKLGDKPTYEGIPIIAIDYLQEGKLLIYDASMRNCIGN